MVSGIGVWPRDPSLTVQSSPSNLQASTSASSANVSAYFSVLALSVLVGEIISRSPSDVRACCSVPGRVLTNCAFLLARLTAVGHLIILQTAPLHRCTDAFLGSTTLYTLSIAFSIPIIYDRLRFASAPRRIQPTRLVRWRSYLLPGIFTFLAIAVVLACALTLVIHIPFPGRLEATNLSYAPAYCALTTTNASADTTTAGGSISGSTPPAPYAAAFLVGPLLITAFVFMLVAGRQVGAYAETFWAAPIAGLRQFLKDCVEILRAGFVQHGQVFCLTSTVVQLLTVILFLLAPSTTSRVALLPLNLSIFTIATGRGYIHAQDARATEERARRTKVFRSLGFESRYSATRINASAETMASLNRSMDGLGGIMVTKTVVQSSE